MLGLAWYSSPSCHTYHLSQMRYESVFFKDMISWPLERKPFFTLSLNWNLASNTTYANHPHFLYRILPHPCQPLRLLSLVVILPLLIFPNPTHFSWFALPASMFLPFIFTLINWSHSNQLIIAQNKLSVPAFTCVYCVVLVLVKMELQHASYLFAEQLVVNQGIECSSNILELLTVFSCHVSPPVSLPISTCSFVSRRPCFICIFCVSNL